VWDIELEKDARYMRAGVANFWKVSGEWKWEETIENKICR
jgi:hypothetical protein